MPGDRVGHFDLVEYVGGGGMGKVFRAIDTRLQRTVAIKVLMPEQAVDADALQRFQNEAQSAARLDHDNIARVYYVGEDRGLHFIVFEFVDGINIRALVERKGPLPLAEATSYMLQAAEALAHSDASAVVHRDIKPSNLLITPEGRVKLIDMGLARLRMVDPAAADLTASGVTLGTFDYISPEQARDPRNADIRSDIYSLGCTFFFMLTGQPPFPEGTVLQKLLQHQGDQPPDVRQFRTDLPEEARSILQRMMAKDPRHRYASPAILAGDLIALAEQIGLRPMSPSSRVWLTPQETPVSFAQRHLPWMIPVALLIAAVGLLRLIDVWSSPATPRADELRQSVNGGRSQPPSSPPNIPATRYDNSDLPTPSTGLSARQVEPGTPTTTSTSTTSARPMSTIYELPPVLPRTAPGEQLIHPEPRTATEDVPPLPPPPRIEALPGDEAGPLPGLAATIANSSTRMPYGSHGGLRPFGSWRPDGAIQRAESPRLGTLIVSERVEGENEFPTLAAACAAARDNDVIELRYDGPRPERPIKMPNARVTIRAADGYRPVIAFQPSESEVDPVKHPRNMFTLASNRLTLADVAIDLDVPRRVAADRWTMFDLRSGQTVRLERCVLSIRNASDRQGAYHPDVAFFRTKSASESERVVSGDTAGTPSITLELTDCVARGEATFLRTEDLQPVRLLWSNGLLATTERLLSAAGGQTLPKPDEKLQLELRQLTAVVRGGLCRMTSAAAEPNSMTVRFTCDDCIFQGTPGSPLIEQEGTAIARLYRRQLLWSGKNNCYENIDVFWTIRNLVPDARPETFNFDQWKAHWGASQESQARVGRLPWQTAPSPDRALNTYVPADFTLDYAAFESAADGTIGATVRRLPQWPAEAVRSDRPRLNGERFGRERDF